MRRTPHASNDLGAPSEGLPSDRVETLHRQLAPLPGPADRVVYAIGDIHGRADLLVRLHAAIRADASARGRASAVVVHLGDYVDRGLYSRAVLDHLAGDPLPGLETVHLCGNHDAWMRDFLADPETGAVWLANGGRETLYSYGVAAGRGAVPPDAVPPGAVPPDAVSPGDLRRLRADLLAVLPRGHRAFLDALRLTWREGGYLFVHAGVRPGVALDRQRAADLTGIRAPFLDSRGRFDGLLAVHGHTIVNRPQVHANRIAVDTGAYATGTLSALVIDADTIGFLQT